MAQKTGFFRYFSRSYSVSQNPGDPEGWYEQEIKTENGDSFKAQSISINLRKNQAQKYETLWIKLNSLDNDLIDITEDEFGESYDQVVHKFYYRAAAAGATSVFSVRAEGVN